MISIRHSGVLLLIFAAACIPRKQPGSSAGSEDTVEGKKCGPDGVIDDGEDNNNQSAAVKGRGGYWYTFADDSSAITPTAGKKGGVFNMSQGGANGSQYGAHMNGKVGAGSIVFAGMGLNFTEPKGQYDASAYKGISFWAKKGSAGTAKVRLKVPDKNTDPDGKVCTECFNDFGTDLVLSEQWTKYVVPFNQMKQLGGWGSPHPAGIDPKTIYGVQFQVNEPGASYDIWVDDVEFTGCP